MIRWIFSFLILIFSLQAKNLPVLLPNDATYAWMDTLVEKEFAQYASGITLEMLDETERSDFQGWPYIRLRVVDGKIYEVKEGQSVLYQGGTSIHTMLAYLMRIYGLPNLEFIYFLGDGLLPNGEGDYGGGPGPLLVSAKDKSATNQILFHDWLFFIGDSNSFFGQNWFTIAEETNKKFDKIPWEKKKRKIFWRGTTNVGRAPWTDESWMEENWLSIPRMKASYLAIVRSDLVDAGVRPFIPSPFLERKEKELGGSLIRSYLSIEKHMAYRYQLCLDGNSCTYTGYPWRLLSGCLTFKQETDNIQWFYPQLQPWIHYIPVQEDLSDLIEKVEWAKAHDKQAKKIAGNARRFVKENIMPEHIALYCYKTLVKYASLQRFEVEAPEEVEKSSHRRRRR